MKANKVSGFVVFAFALVFAIIGAVLLLLPEPVSPVTVNGMPTAHSYAGEIKVDFTLENESDEDVTVTYIEVTVSSDGGTVYADTDENMRIKAGDSQKCTYYIESANYAKSITKISVTVNGKKYNAYATSSTMDTVAVIFFIMAAIFAVLTVVSFVGVVKQKKRYASIKQEINEKFAGSAIFTVGCYGKKGEAGKAVAKTAASAVGGAIFAGLFGFGTYKIYGANTQKEFVVSDDGLFIGDPLKQGFNLGGMTYLEKGTLSQSEITVKKKHVTLSNKSSGEFFVFDLSGNKDVTTDQLVEKLNNLTAPLPTDVGNEATAESSEVAATDTSDPFDL